MFNLTYTMQPNKMYSLHWK